MHPYDGAQVVLPTLHGKEAAFAPAFKSILNINVTAISLNTDLLGTFSGEIERVDDPLTTAIKKTELAKIEGHSPYFLASEGSIGNHPSIPFLISDTELAIFRDSEKDLTIQAVHTSFDIKAHRIEILPSQEIDDFLAKADFPHHALIAKGKDLSVAPPIKGIRDLRELSRAIETIAQKSPTIILENDFRAHQSPSRMANIAMAAEKLALRVAELCPSCGCPGFGVVDIERGVRCEECGGLNEEAPRQEILGCYRCPERVSGKVINDHLPAERCLFCNP